MTNIEDKELQLPKVKGDRLNKSTELLIVLKLEFNYPYIGLN